LNFLDKNNSFISSLVASSSTADSNWHFVSTTGAVPALAVRANITLLDATVGGGTVEFDNIQAFRLPLASEIPTLSQDTTGLAAKATILATARAINGQNFDGSGDITVPVNNANDG